MERLRQRERPSMGPSLVIESIEAPEIAGSASISRPTSNDRIAGTLHLQGGTDSDRRVTWGEDVIDNENMGKKKSKICCIFHKQRKFDESSSEESSSEDGDNHDSSSDDDNEKSDRRKHARYSRGHPHKHPHKYSHKHSHRRNASPNAYERQPRCDNQEPGKSL